MCGYDGTQSYQKSKTFSFIAGDLKSEVTTLECSFRNLFSRPEDWPTPYLFDGIMYNPSIPEIIQPVEIKPPKGWTLGEWLGIDWLVNEYSYDRLQRADIIKLAEDWANFKN